jgi:hypothetical protein
MKPACYLRFTAALAVQPSGFDGFVKNRRRTAEALTSLPGMR